MKRLINTKSRFSDASLKLRCVANDKNVFTSFRFYSKDCYQVDLPNTFGGIIAGAIQYD